jgi:hypothetical protein
MSEPTPAAMTLSLFRCKSSDAGHLLGLKTGDVLVSVDGKTWAGGITALKARFSQRGGPVALTFLRGDAVWTVLADRPDLGQWRQEPRPAGISAPRIEPELLCNWEIVANADWTHDLFPLRPSVPALIAPAFWLAHRRLWTLLATLVAALAVALPAGIPLVIGLWVAAGLHLWRNGADHIRADRLGAGFHRVGMIAARTEAEAIETWRTLRPNSRFQFETSGAQGRVEQAT